MDPLSISLACISLIGAVAQTSTVVTNFVRDVRGVNNELDGVSRELQSLKALLEMLADEAGDLTSGRLPETLKRQISGIVTNCTGVVAEIERTLNRHEGSGLAKAARWTATGQGDISKLRSSLEAHKSALEIALDMVTLTLARDIKADTNEILEGNSTIKQDTTQILAEIIRLQAQMTGETNLNNSSGYMLERYLDNLTSYAESVCGTFPDSMPIDHEPELSVLSESEAASPRSTRPFPNQESDDAEVLDIKYSSNNEPTPSKEHSIEDGYESDGWQGTAEEEHRERSIQNPDRVANLSGAIGKGLQRYNGDRFDTPYNDMEHPQPEDVAQYSPQQQRTSTQSVLDWVTRTHGLVPLEDTGLSTIAAARWKAVREVKLFNGNLVLDCPVPKRILNNVIHGTPPIRDEFTHVRYSALTCHPSEFRDSRFVLRPSLFAKPRSTKVLVAISISENDLISPAKQAAFARTLRSAIQSVRPETWANHVSGKDIWKNIVIGIITDGTVEVASLSVLEEMGVYWNDPDCRKSSVNHKDVRAHLYEYTAQLIPYIDKLEVKVVKEGLRPVQMMLCLQEKKNAFPTQAWVECFGTFLRARICVAVVPGMEVHGEKLYAMWNAARNQLRSGNSNGPKIIPYQENWLRYLRRLWMSE